MKKKKVAKIFLIIFAVVLLIAILVSAIIAGIVLKKFDKINIMELENIEMNEGIEEKLDGYRNIAILGVDARADKYSDTRSDCIIIASINERTKEVKLVSIYRDTYVYIDGHGFDKINHAYAYGGPELAINTINKNLDLNITEFVAVNFDAVVEIIDAVGGVSVDVDSEEIKYINSYINGVNNQMGRHDANITHTGKQNLSGVQALAYSRIRYTNGGDYKRTERMREVLNLTFEKAKNINIIQLNKIADMLLPRVYTNIPKNEIFNAIPDISKYATKASIGWPYEVKEYYPADVWYGAPVNLENNVIRLHKELFGDNDYVVSDKVKEISEAIIEKTGN